MSLITESIDLIEGCANAADAHLAAADFAKRMQPHGLRGLATRVYRRPEGPLDSAALWKAGGHVATIWPANWEDTPGYRYICFTENPLLEAVRKRQAYFRFTDLAPRKSHGAYWEAFSEGRIGDGMGVLHFASQRRVASLSLAFEEIDFSPAEQAALRAAGTALIQRTAELAPVEELDAPQLTARERDCMAYVAAGKSDWDISVILGLSQATVRFHVDNARRKLDAVTRSQAVARMAALDLI